MLESQCQQTELERFRLHLESEYDPGFNVGLIWTSSILSGLFFSVGQTDGDERPHWTWTHTHTHCMLWCAGQPGGIQIRLFWVESAMLAQVTVWSEAKAGSKTTSVSLMVQRFVALVGRLALYGALGPTICKLANYLVKSITNDHKQHYWPAPVRVEREKREGQAESLWTLV